MGKSIDEIISAVDYAFEMYISEFDGCSEFDREETEQDRKEAVELIKSQQAENERLKSKHIEIVRCMECIYAMVAPDDNGYFYCKYPFASKAPHESHFYCANGVRKDGDGDG